jgi:hypothetical protein
MVSRHLDHDLLVLYIVSYGVTDDVVDEDKEEDSEYERTVVYRKDPFWDSVLSDDTDCMDSMRMLLLCRLMRGLKMLEGLLMMKMKVWNGMLVLMVIVVRVMLVIVIEVMLVIAIGVMVVRVWVMVGMVLLWRVGSQ